MAVVSGALQIHSNAQALSALAWLVDAGVDTLVDDAPYAWLAPPAPVQAPPPPVAEPIMPCEAEAVVEARAAVVDADTLEALDAAVRAFDGCTLAAHGAPFFADGTPGSAVMLIGDAPSADGVIAGPAGLLLDRMLAAIGLSRESAYIANLVYWPTPGGRPPAAAEIAACAPFLARHIELAAPKVVLALGGAAAAALTGIDSGINRLRGKWQAGAHGVAVLPTFHPDHLLRQPAHKALAWHDLLTLKARLTDA
ncbi:uracil-DNA glycosylase [Glacieibacterium frigidum]|uniref:Uracil-DNA glycosylase n=1 Tax=Glacieibacterium frigidum TaxID=2593303 RepID=A0A552UHZ8_9SPHN|nr:uracil-DNA glycosylase [Glacieibacterium frigidum]